MSDGTVILGGIAFQDFEIPNKINFGGKQVHKVHEMVGGQRVVDAMGPSPDNITWSGRFRGGSAIARARAVDAMRIAGAAVSLSWLGLFYTVLVTEFIAETEKRYEVPYRIVCTVVDDPSADGGASGGGTSLDSLVSADLTAAAGILASATSNVSTALAGASAAVAAIPQLQGSSIATLAPAVLAAQAAANAVSATVAANDPPLDTASPDGADPNLIASWLTTSAANATAQSALADGGAYVERAALNMTLGAS